MTFSPLYGLFRILLTKDRHHSRDIAFDIGDFVGIVELIDLILEAKLEKVAFQFL